MPSLSPDVVTFYMWDVLYIDCLRKQTGDFVGKTISTKEQPPHIDVLKQQNYAKLSAQLFVSPGTDLNAVPPYPAFPELTFSAAFSPLQNLIHSFPVRNSCIQI